jgi:uncharacterized DUF497 family protein
MEIEWDEQKRGVNLSKHGLDFADVERILALPLLVALDDREDFGEDRWVGIGLLNGRVVVLGYTEPDEDTLRVISLRKALTYEQKRFEKFLTDELGAG